MNNTYRLTPTDEDRIRSAVAATIRTWTRNSTTGKLPRNASNAETLLRIAAAAIGCGTNDLRDVEIAWIETHVTEQLAGAK